MSTDAKEVSVVDAEFEAASDVTSNLTPGQSLIVAEVNAIRSMAVAKPRDNFAIAESLKQTLIKYPGMALKMRYCKPVGWKTYAKCKCGREYEAAGWAVPWHDRHKIKECPSCGVKDAVKLRPEQQFARGLSVKAAELLATEIMYCRTDVGVEMIDQNTYKVTAKFFDVQSGRYNSRESIVSRLTKKWGGSIERIDDDRFFNLTIPAAQSKILREMVNRAVPFVIRHVLEETVDELIDQQLLPEQVEKIVGSFSRFQISASDLEAILGTKREHWNHEDRRRCLEMFESLKSKEVTREELLSAITLGADGSEPAAITGDKPAAPKTLDDINPSTTAAKQTKSPPKETPKETPSP